MLTLPQALAYARYGFRVFPVHTIRDGACSCGGKPNCMPAKHPCILGWQKKATTDEATIRDWWSRWPDANIGIAPGKESGIFVLDVDGEPGETQLAKLEAEHGPLPETTEVKSGRAGGGRHLYFKYPEDGRGIPSWLGKDTAKEGLDCLSDSRYVIAPPSIHASGTRYKCKKPVDPAEAPDWLIDYVRGAPGGRGRAASPQGWIGPMPAELTDLAAKVEHLAKDSMGGINAPPAYSEAEGWRICSALEVIPAKNYDVWLKIGMALHWLGQGQGWGDIPFRIWDVWSQRAPEEYARANLPEKWKTFHDDGGITIGTLYTIAREHEWKRDDTADVKAAQRTTEAAEAEEDLPEATASDDKNFMPGQPVSASKGSGKTAELTQREKLIAIGITADLWHDRDGEGYATIGVQGHAENCAIKSLPFRRWLLSEYGRRFPLKINGRTIPSGTSAQAVSEALATIDASAAVGPEVQPAVRVAGSGTSIFIDLGTPDWRAVEITPQGWQIIDAPAVRFIRPKGLHPFPVPVGGGRVSELRSYLNVASDDDFLLVVAWALGALRAQKAFPVLILNGEQDSAKSTACRVLRRLIDPNAAPLRKPPKDEQDLLIAAKNGHLLVLDNLSFVENDLSDALCRISTGGGSSKRALYTNGEEFLIDVCKPILLNGIPSLASKPDLVDRSIVLNLPAIEARARRSEEDFWTEFDQAAPRLFGALLSVLSGALRRLPNIALRTSPRMLDFVRFAEAACQEGGCKPGAFETAYETNKARLTDEATEADAVAKAIIELVENEGNFGGTATGLLDAIGRRVFPGDRGKYWPADGTRMSSRLTRIAPLLRAQGFDVERNRDKQQRHIEIKKRQEGV
ncbi:Primase C terminal 2 (PriCT-2) [Rhizobiales bacterium GAS191]|nr:Primase C terminal 2 (PriCT-2) [Rhizobiales bacterium GAS191]